MNKIPDGTQTQLYDLVNISTQQEMGMSYLEEKEALSNNNYFRRNNQPYRYRLRR